MRQVTELKLNDIIDDNNTGKKTRICELRLSRSGGVPIVSIVTESGFKFSTSSFTEIQTYNEAVFFANYGNAQ